MSDKTRHKPGDVVCVNDMEFIAAQDKTEDGRCETCIGNHGSTCLHLPMGCAVDDIVWHPHNDAARLIPVLVALGDQPFTDPESNQ